VTAPKSRHGPEPERLKIDLPLAEGLRRLVHAKPKPRLRLVNGKPKRGR
jgi:hypothetical protein